MTRDWTQTGECPECWLVLWWQIDDDVVTYFCRGCGWQESLTVTVPAPAAALCPDCGHQHSTPAFGSICVGCDCQSVPAIVGPR